MKEGFQFNFYLSLEDTKESMKYLDTIASVLDSLEEDFQEFYFVSKKEDLQFKVSLHHHEVESVQVDYLEPKNRLPLFYDLDAKALVNEGWM